jgi:hypothetical protein
MFDRLDEVFGTKAAAEAQSEAAEVQALLESEEGSKFVPLSPGESRSLDGSSDQAFGPPVSERGGRVRGMG